MLLQPHPSKRRVLVGGGGHQPSVQPVPGRQQAPVSGTGPPSQRRVGSC